MIESLTLFIVTNAVTLVAVVLTLISTLGILKFREFRKNRKPKTEEFLAEVLFKNMLTNSNNSSAQLLVGTDHGIIRLPATAESIAIFDKISKYTSLGVTLVPSQSKKLGSLQVIDVLSVEVL